MQGGYIIAAPSPGYEVVLGDWAELPSLAKEAAVRAGLKEPTVVKTKDVFLVTRTV